MTALLDGITASLAGSWLNGVVAGHFWIVPALQTVHILAVAAVLASVVVINLRVVGLVDLGQPLAVLLDRFLPPIAIGVGILAVTGLLLIAGEPTRAPYRVIFWVKLALIVAAAVLTWSHRRASPVASGGTLAIGIGRKGVALLALSLWLGVIVAGRWIAYADAWPGAPA